MSGGPANSSSLHANPVANPHRTGFEGTDEQLCMDVELCVGSCELCWPGAGWEAKHLLLFLTDCETKSLVATEFAAKKCQLMSSLLENITAPRSVGRCTADRFRTHLVTLNITSQDKCKAETQSKQAE